MKKLALTSAIVVVLATGPLVLRAKNSAAARPQNASQSREEDIMTVRDVSELRPRTAAERLRAQFFNGYGAEGFERGSAVELIRAGLWRTRVNEEGFRPASGASRITFSYGGGAIRMAGGVIRIDANSTIPLREPIIFFGKHFNTTELRDAYRSWGWESIQPGDVELIERQIPACPSR